MISSRSIDELFPTVQRAAVELLRRMKEQGFDIGISSTYRDFEAQNELYAQGRTKPGAIVTNARGGESMHNYRLAFDVFQNIKGAEYDSNVLRLVGEEAERMGLEWGGSWVWFTDMPHMQWTDGLTLSQLQNGEMPQDKKLTWETEPAPPEGPALYVEKADIMIDGCLYKINRILVNDKNYVELRGFEPAGYEVGYIESEKLPTIKKL